MSRRLSKPLVPNGQTSRNHFPRLRPSSTVINFVLVERLDYENPQSQIFERQAKSGNALLFNQPAFKVFFKETPFHIASLSKQHFYPTAFGTPEVGPS